MSSEITIAITPGDPAGIGPEVIIKALKQWDRPRECRVVVFGHEEFFKPYDDETAPIRFTSDTEEVAPVDAVTSLLHSHLYPSVVSLELVADQQAPDEVLEQGARRFLAQLFLPVVLLLVPGMASQRHQVELGDDVHRRSPLFDQPV